MIYQCTICMACLNPSDMTFAAKCGHVFHEGCLTQWFMRSRTCPQCRSICDQGSILRLYFSAMNNSTVDNALLEAGLLELKLQLKAKDHENALLESRARFMRTKIKDSKDSIRSLECIKLQRERELENASAEIYALNFALKRYQGMEKEMKEKTAQIEDFLFIQSVIDSTKVEVEDLMLSNRSQKSLATALAVTKRELNNVLQKKNEINNALQNCMGENRMHVTKLRNLLDRINILESDNYKLKDDLSQFHRYSSEPKNSECVQNALENLFAQTSTTDKSSATKVKNISPYINIMQSNVGASPLSNRKKNQQELSPYSRKLTIFESRKLNRNDSAFRSRGLVHNGYGGSERKENVQIGSKFSTTGRSAGRSSKSRRNVSQ